MLVDLGLPSFNAVLHNNAAASFSRRLSYSINCLVKYAAVCNYSSVIIIIIIIIIM